MFIVFEGADLTGKTSLAQRVSKELRKGFFIKNMHIPRDVKKTPEELVDAYFFLLRTYDCMKEGRLPHSNLIIDRYYISEWVYSNVFRGYDASKDSRLQRLDELMEIYPATLVLVDCDEELLHGRKRLRGEDKSIDQILEARALYRRFYKESRFKHKISVINNDWDDQNRNTELITQFLHEQ